MLSALQQQIILTVQDDTLPYTVVLHGARILCEKAGKRSCDTE